MLSGDNSPSTFTQDENPKPTAQAVADFHTNSDADSRAESLHHTLGPNPNQASPGDTPMMVVIRSFCCLMKRFLVRVRRTLGGCRLMLFLYVLEQPITLLPNAF